MMGGNAAGAGGPRQLFPGGGNGMPQVGGAASAAGMGQPAGGNGGGLGSFGMMAPAIFQSMQQGNMNPMFSAAIGQALSGNGMFGGQRPQQMNQPGMGTQPAPLPGGMPQRSTQPAQVGPGMSSGIGLPGESRIMGGLGGGAPMQFGPAQPNPGLQGGPGNFQMGSGFGSSPVPFINRPPPITSNPNAIPPAMQNPQPLFPTNPGSGIRAGDPVSQPGAGAVAGSGRGQAYDTGRIAYLQSMLQNPDQSAPIARLRARQELARLTGG